MACVHQHAGRDRVGAALARGREVWALRERVRTGAVTRPDALTWAVQPDVLLLDSEHVVYCVMAKRGSHRRYVGITTQGAWTRQVQRVQSAFWHGGKRDTLDPFSRHLLSRGRDAALADFYIIPLEMVPPLQGESAAQWNVRAQAWERWWVHYLASGKHASGWNVAHAEKVIAQRYRANGAVRTVAKTRPKAMRWVRALARKSGVAPSTFRRRVQTANAMHDEPPSTRVARKLHGQRLRRRERRRSGPILDRALAEWSSGSLVSYLNKMGLSRMRSILWVLNTRLTHLDPNGAEHATILAMIRTTTTELARHRAQTVARPTRSLVIGGYIGRAVDSLRLGSILCDQRVTECFPPEAASILGQPMWVVKYHERLAQLVCNWGAASRSTGIMAPRCVCAQPHFRPFIHGSTGHVCTKDLSIVRCPELRELLRRGPNYRLRPVTSRPPRSGGREAADYVRGMVQAALEEFAKTQQEVNGISPAAFLPWIAAVMELVEPQIRGLGPRVLDEVMDWSEDEIGWTVDAEREVRKLQRSFVIQPADKETGVMTLTCRALWEERLLAEAHGTATYETAGYGAAAHVRGKPTTPHTANDRAARAIAAPQPPPPVFTRAPPRATAQRTSSMDISHAARVLRAAHAFGILGMAVTPTFPSSDRVEVAYRRVRAAVANQVVTEASQVSISLALARVDDAWYKLRSTPVRRRTWLRIRSAPRPETRTLPCPIDVGRLQAYVVSDESLEVFSSQMGAGAATQRTGRELVTTFLQHVTLDSSDPSMGSISIVYRHSEAAEQMIAAGFIVASREYAVGADPFRLKRKLRALALARFGFDFDDSASFPRAALALLCAGSSRARAFLGARKQILRALAAHYFPGLAASGVAGAAEARDRVKKLFNSLDMDGTFGSWLNNTDDFGRPFSADIPITRRTRRGVVVHPTAADTAAGLFSDGPFDLEAYVAEQPVRTAEVRDRMPLMVAICEQLNSEQRRSQVHHERTAKSYILQEMEAFSREAKLAWCSQQSCVPINLQHDGVVIRLQPGWLNQSGPEDVEASLSDFCSAAVGYTQSVEVKPWEGGMVATDHLPPVPGNAALRGVAGALPTDGAYSLALRKQFNYTEARKMVPRAWGPGTPRRPSDEDPEAKETPWEAFARRYGIPYLYAVVKTHKEPYGWRFISGGSDIALNLVSDWLHMCLSGIQSDVHNMAAQTLVAVAPQGQPSLEAFYIRDSRDVVRRIQELEVRRRATLRAQAILSGVAPAWRRCHFSVYDFTTLYPSLPHTEIMTAIAALLNRVFSTQRRSHASNAPCYLSVRSAGRGSCSARWARASWGQNAWQRPADHRGVRHFTADEIMGDLRFILGNTFMTVGDEVLQQVCGVPMGLSCSPMVSVMMLAWHEIQMLERMATAAAGQMGSMVDMPAGRVALTPRSRDALVGLACRISRCCRAIDDVLLIDLDPTEQKWVLSRMYPNSLELKKVCASPARIQYLDLEVAFDRGGFHTMLYDKRDELRLQGKMDVVRRFPHAQSMLSEQCRYSCLSAFLHRAWRVDMRTAYFVRHSAERIVEMYADGYEMRKLLQTAQRFLQTFFRPAERSPAVFARIREAALFAAESTHRDTADVPRRTGARGALRSDRQPRAVNPRGAAVDSAPTPAGVPDVDVPDAVVPDTVAAAAQQPSPPTSVRSASPASSAAPPASIHSGYSEEVEAAVDTATAVEQRLAPLPPAPVHVPPSPSMTPPASISGDLGEGEAATHYVLFEGDAFECVD